MFRSASSGPSLISRTRRATVLADWINLYTTRTRFFQPAAADGVRQVILRGDPRRVYFLVANGTTEPASIFPSDFVRVPTTVTVTVDTGIRLVQGAAPYECYADWHGRLVTDEWSVQLTDPFPVAPPALLVIEGVLTGTSLLGPPK